MVRRTQLAHDHDDHGVPSFFWDRNVTATELRRVLDEHEHPDRHRLLGTLLREARPDEVWRWISPREVYEALPSLRPFLGRRREFWEWLMSSWAELGLV